MSMRFTNAKCYTKSQLQELFQSVNWVSGNYPQRLMKALSNCETVITAWDDEKLIGLINAIDDGELTAYVHYLCVRPEYQGRGIGKKLLEYVKDIYEDYLYLIIIAESDELVDYYEKNGLKKVEGTHVMAIQNK